MFSRSKHLLSKNIPIQGVTRLPQFGVSDGGIWELRLLSHYYLKCNLVFLVGRRSMNYVGPDLSSSLKNPDGHPPRGVPQCPSTHGLWCEAHLGAQNPASPIPPADTSPPWPLVTSCSIRCSTSSVFIKAYGRNWKIQNQSCLLMFISRLNFSSGLSQEYSFWWGHLPGWVVGSFSSLLLTVALGFTEMLPCTEIVMCPGAWDTALFPTDGLFKTLPPLLAASFQCLPIH